jgi:hypothetical protein
MESPWPGVAELERYVPYLVLRRKKLDEIYEMVLGDSPYDCDLEWVGRAASDWPL